MKKTLHIEDRPIEPVTVTGWQTFNDLVPIQQLVSEPVKRHLSHIGQTIANYLEAGFILHVSDSIGIDDHGNPDGTWKAELSIRPPAAN